MGRRRSISKVQYQEPERDSTIDSWQRGCAGPSGGTRPYYTSLWDSGRQPGCPVKKTALTQEKLNHADEASD